MLGGPWIWDKNISLRQSPLPTLNTLVSTGNTVTNRTVPYQILEIHQYCAEDDKPFQIYITYIYNHSCIHSHQMVVISRLIIMIFCTFSE